MQRKGPLPGKIFARRIPERRFVGLFGYMTRISCQSQLVLDAWRANLARKGRFSRPRPLLGYIERKNCHGLPPGNASREHIATVGRPGAHRAKNLPQAAAQRADPPPRSPLRGAGAVGLASRPRTAPRRVAARGTMLLVAPAQRCRGFVTLGPRLSPRRCNAERCRRCGASGAAMPKGRLGYDCSWLPSGASGWWAILR